MVKFSKLTSENTHPSEVTDVEVSKKYADLSSGKQSSITVSGGVGNPRFAVMDFPIADQPKFGSGVLSEFKLGLFTHEYHQGSTGSLPTGVVYKLLEKVGPHDGNINVELETPLIFSSYMSELPNSTAYVEDFSNSKSATDTVVETKAGSLIEKKEPYLLFDDAWDKRDLDGATLLSKSVAGTAVVGGGAIGYGLSVAVGYLATTVVLAAAPLIAVQPITKSHFHRYYAEKLDDGTRIIPITLSPDGTKYVPKKTGWWSAIIDDPSWSLSAKSTLGFSTASGDIGKYIKYKTETPFTAHPEKTTNLNTDTTFFDVCKEVPNRTSRVWDETTSDWGETKETAVSDIGFSTSKALTGQSLCMRTFIDYPNAGSTDGGHLVNQDTPEFNGSPRQDIYCLKTFIPTPVRYNLDTLYDYELQQPFTSYENETFQNTLITGEGQGFLSSKLTLDIDMYIDKLEPDYIDDAVAATLKNRRMFAICFSDVVPKASDNFNDFIKSNTDAASTAAWNKNFAGVVISDHNGDGEYRVADITRMTLGTDGYGVTQEKAPSFSASKVPGGTWIRLRLVADPKGGRPMDSAFSGDGHTWNLMLVNPSDNTIAEDFNASGGPNTYNMFGLKNSLEASNISSNDGYFDKWGFQYKAPINHPRQFPKHMSLWLCNYKSNQSGHAGSQIGGTHRSETDQNLTILGSIAAYDLVNADDDGEAGNRPCESIIYIDKIAFKRVSPKIVNCTPSNANTGFLANSFKIVNKETLSHHPDHETELADTMGNSQLKMKAMSPPTVLSFGFNSPSDLGTVHSGTKSGLMLFNNYFTGNLAVNEKIHDAKMMAGWTRKEYSPLLGDFVEGINTHDRKEKNISLHMFGIDIGEGPKGGISEYRSGAVLTGAMAADSSSTSPQTFTVTGGTADFAIADWVRIDGEMMLCTGINGNSSLNLLRRATNLMVLAPSSGGYSGQRYINKFMMPRFMTNSSLGAAATAPAHVAGSRIFVYKKSGGPTITTSAYQIAYIDALVFTHWTATVADNDMHDGTTITIHDGTVSKTFEFDDDDSVTSGNIAVEIGPAGVGSSSATAYGGPLHYTFINLVNAINSVASFDIEAIYANADLNYDGISGYSKFSPAMSDSMPGIGACIKIRRTVPGNDDDAAITMALHDDDDFTYSSPYRWLPRIALRDFSTSLDKACESFTQKGYVKFDKGSKDVMTDNWIKRENPWVSAKITKLINPGKGEFEVDNMDAFKNFPDDEYIIYRYGENGNAPKFKIVLSGAAADGDKITITDTVNTTVFEFDDDSSVTSGNHPVTIGTTAECMSRLADAIDLTSEIPSVAGTVGSVDDVRGYWASNGNSSTATNDSEVWVEFIDWFDSTGTQPSVTITTDTGNVMSVSAYGGNATNVSKESSNAPTDPTYIAPVKIRQVSENIMQVSYIDSNGQPLSRNLSEVLNEDNLNALRISPYKYWMFWQIRHDENHKRDSIGITSRAVYKDLKSYAPRSYGSMAFVDSNTTVGYTYNESIYFVDSDTNNQSYYRAHNLLPQPGGDLEVEKDYGFGVWEEEATNESTAVGCVSKFKVKKGRTEALMPNLVKVDGDLKPGKILSFMISTDELQESHEFKFYSSDYTTDINKRPYLLTIFEDSLPDIEDFMVKPNEKNPYYPEFTWSVKSDDLWYGLLNVDSTSISNQYHNAVVHFPLNEEPTFGTTGDADERAYHRTTAQPPIENISDSTTTVSITGAQYDVEGLAGYCLRFDGDDDFVLYGGAGDPTADATTELTVVAHIVPDAGSSDDRYIIAQEATDARKFSLHLNSLNQIVARVYRTNTAYVELTSSVILIADGETPTSVILTVDTSLKSGNVKLFINGKLDDMSGFKISTGTTNNWQSGATMQSGSSYIVIGNAGSTSDWQARNSAFAGKLEEIVIYKKALYPFVPKEGKYIFTKPVSELGISSLASSKSYAAKIFVKDYHNIRGTDSTEVATAPQVSWRKAAFALDTS